MATDNTHAQVQDYYGTQLQTSQDLLTNACCTDDIPLAHRRILSQLEPEVLEKYYGCGVCIPDAIEGITVLDLGSGSGRDAYLLSKLVGEHGHVIGVDMTEEQLDVARRNIGAHTEKFGYAQPNVEFRHGFIEDLAAAGLADNSVDLVVSNCVLNLSTDKEATYREIFRVLKPGGELFIADVFADRRVPEILRQDPILYGECLSGAMYTEDFRRLLLRLGINVAEHEAPRSLAQRVRQHLGERGQVMAALLETLDKQRYGRNALRWPDAQLTRRFNSAAKAVRAS